MTQELIDGRWQVGDVVRRTPYLMVEGVEGELLATLLQRASVRKTLSVKLVIALGDSLFESLTAIHALGYAGPGLSAEEIVVLGNGQAVMLAVDRACPSNTVRSAFDVARACKLLLTLLEATAQQAETEGLRERLRVALKAKGEATLLHHVWRFAAGMIGDDEILDSDLLEDDDFLDPSDIDEFAETVAAPMSP